MRNKSGGRNRRRKEKKKWEKNKVTHSLTKYTNFAEKGAN